MPAHSLKVAGSIVSLSDWLNHWITESLNRISVSLDPSIPHALYIPRTRQGHGCVSSQINTLERIWPWESRISIEHVQRVFPRRKHVVSDNRTRPTEREHGCATTALFWIHNKVNRSRKWADFPKRIRSESRGQRVKFLLWCVRDCVTVSVLLFRWQSCGSWYKQYSKWHFFSKLIFVL